MNRSIRTITVIFLTITLVFLTVFFIFYHRELAFRYLIVLLAFILANPMSINPLYGVILGLIFGIISSMFLTNYKEWKTKRRIALYLRIEIDLNIEKMRNIVEGTFIPFEVYECKNKAYNASLHHIPLFNRRLIRNITLWYDDVDTMFREWRYNNKHPLLQTDSESEMTKSEKAKTLCSQGVTISKELDRISSSCWSWETVFGI